MLNAPIRFFSTIILTSIPAIALAVDDDYRSEQYLGLGISRISINSAHPSIHDQSISGITLLYGIRRDSFVFETVMGGGGGIDTEPTSDIYYPEDTADYGFISFSFLYHFRDLQLQGNVVPYVGGGYSINSINWQTYVYDHSGDGYTFTAGAAFPIDRYWSVQGTFQYINFSGERILFSSGDYPNYNTETYLYSINVLYHFIDN